MARGKFHPRGAGSEVCNDPVVGAILSGWRYDISEISPDLRVDYETHLYNCSYCRKRQRVHRTWDVMLLLITTVSFGAFLLAALVMHRVEAISHISNVQHLHLHDQKAASLLRIPTSISISLEALAICGVFISMLLWTLVTITTPIPSMISALFRERISPELRERLRKQAI
ncbi:MAG: hypothetical protein ACP5E5_01980 [Acidobacteriaceae bacterium]